VNALFEKYQNEIERVLAKYPPEQKRAAVMPLLYLAQSDRGYVTRLDLNEIGEILEISSTDVGSIVGFYTLYHDHPGGAHRIQVCNDLACALRGADEFLDQLCENLGIQVGETTGDGVVTVEAVMCLAACDKAPMFQVQDTQGIRYFENQTVESALALVQAWREGTPEPAGVVISPSVSDSKVEEVPAEIQAEHAAEEPVEVGSQPTGDDLPEANGEQNFEQKDADE
jgi:NADH-quinone oxidoreductase subunit E